jgi:hypothetical protein
MVARRPNGLRDQCPTVSRHSPPPPAEPRTRDIAWQRIKRWFSVTPTGFCGLARAGAVRQSAGMPYFDDSTDPVPDAACNRLDDRRG